MYSSHTHTTDTILLVLIFMRYTCFSFSAPIRISNRITKETKRKQIFFLHLFCPVCVSFGNANRKQNGLLCISLVIRRFYASQILNTLYILYNGKQCFSNVPRITYK